MNTNGGHMRPEEINQLVDSGRRAEEIIREHAHLQSCRQCRANMTQLGRIDSALRSLPLPETGDGFTAGVLARIGQPMRGDAPGPSFAYAKTFLYVLVAISIAAGTLLLGATAARPPLASGAGVFLKRMLDRAGNIAVDALGLLIGHVGAAVDQRTVVLSIVGLATVIALAILDEAIVHRFGGRVTSGR